jgi:alcohol dehydrogenase class IV
MVMRHTPVQDTDSPARLASALGVWQHGMSAETATLATAEALEAFYRRIAMPTRVRELGLPEADLPLLARDTLKNFNANAGWRSDTYVDDMLRLLQAAW